MAESKELINAIILVGSPTGFTRFRPLSLDLAKPLFPVGGKPLIYHHIAALAHHCGSRLRKVFLLGSYDTDIFAQFISDTANELGVDLEYLKESESLGTAGGIFAYRQVVCPEDITHFFLLHSDTCCTFPLDEMLAFHKQHGKDGTMLGKKVLESEAMNYGCYVADPSSGRMLHYAEKPESFISDTINAGIYLFSRSLFQANIKRSASRDLRSSLMLEMTEKTSNPLKLSMEYDVLPSLSEAGLCHALEYKGFWCTVKSAGSAAFANLQYLSYYTKAKSVSPGKVPKYVGSLLGQDPNYIGPVIVHPDAKVDPSSKIGPNVYIGPNTTIGPGVRVSNSIILSDVMIKDHSCVMHSILSNGCVVGKWSRVEGIPTPDGSKKRDRITVFGSNVVVNAEIMVRNCIVMSHKHLEQSFMDEILL